MKITIKGGPLIGPGAPAFRFEDIGTPPVPMEHVAGSNDVAKSLPSLGEIMTHRGGGAAGGAPRGPVKNPGSRGGRFHYDKKGGVAYGEEAKGRQPARGRPARTEKRKAVFKNRRQERAQAAERTRGQLQRKATVQQVKSAVKETPRALVQKAAKALKAQYGAYRPKLVRAFRQAKNLGTKSGLFYTALRVSETWAKFEHWCKHRKLDAEELVIHALLEAPHVMHVFDAVLHVAGEVLKSERPAIDQWLDSLPPLPRERADLDQAAGVAPSRPIAPPPPGGWLTSLRNSIADWLRVDTVAKAEQFSLFGPAGEGSIKHGGKAHLGVDRIGRTHWRANADLPDPPQAPAPPAPPPPPPPSEPPTPPPDDDGDEGKGEGNWRVVANRIAERAVRGELGPDPREDALAILDGHTSLTSVTSRDLASWASQDVNQIIAAGDDYYDITNEKRQAMREASARVEALVVEIRKLAHFEFWIPESRMETFRAKIDSLNKRAKRQGLRPIELRVREEEIRRKYRWAKADETVSMWARPGEDPGQGWEETGRVQPFQRVRVIGDSPRIEGWEFVARIEHGQGDDDDVGNLVQHVPGHEAELPEKYRTVGPDCDHCKVTRRRNDTFILRRDEEHADFVQVGRTCLKDFLGHPDPEHFAKLAELMAEARAAAGGEDEDESVGGGGGEWIEMTTFLPWVAKAIREHGWVSRKVSSEHEGMRASADVAREWIWDIDNAKLAPHEKPDRPTEEDKAKAAAALAWILEKDEDEIRGSDYLWNLRVLAKRGAIRMVGRKSHEGLAASLVSTYMREAGEALWHKKKAKEELAFHGKVGDKLNGLVVTVDRMTEYPSKYGRGAVYLFLMHDEEGNHFKWWASNRVLKEGETVLIDGTIKAHEEYKGNKETVITRVARIEAPTPPAEIEKPIEVDEEKILEFLKFNSYRRLGESDADLLARGRARAIEHYEGVNRYIAERNAEAQVQYEKDLKKFQKTLAKIEKAKGGTVAKSYLGGFSQWLRDRLDLWPDEGMVAKAEKKPGKVAQIRDYADKKKPAAPAADDQGEDDGTRHITIHQRGPDTPGHTVRMVPHPERPGVHHIHPDDRELAGKAMGQKVKAKPGPKLPGREQFEAARLPAAAEWGEGDGVVFHVTAYGRLADIVKRGLDPATAGEPIEGVDHKFGGAKQEYSEGKIFFADTKEAATTWWGHLEDHMILSTDLPDHQTRVMLRVVAPADLAPDDEGSQDVAESSYSTEKIEPADIEYWDGKHWIAADQKAMTTSAKGAPADGEAKENLAEAPADAQGATKKPAPVKKKNASMPAGGGEAKENLAPAKENFASPEGGGEESEGESPGERWSANEAAGDGEPAWFLDGETEDDAKAAIVQGDEGFEAMLPGGDSLGQYETLAEAAEAAETAVDGIPDEDEDEDAGGGDGVDDEDEDEVRKAARPVKRPGSRGGKPRYTERGDVRYDHPDLVSGQYCCLEGCPSAADFPSILCAEHLKDWKNQALTAEQQLRFHERRTSPDKFGPGSSVRVRPW